MRPGRLLCGAGAAGFGAVILATSLAPAGDDLTVPVLAIVRWAMQGAGIVATGFALLMLLVRAEPDTDEVADLARRLLAVAGLVQGGLAVVALWLHAADAVGLPPWQLPVPTMAAYATTLAHGRGLVLTALCGALLATALVPAVGEVLRRRPEAALGVALLGLLPGPVGGHAAGQAGHGAAVVLIALHVGAAAVWIGGLFALLTAVPRTRWPLALTRFSAVAGWAVLLVAVGGVASAGLRLAGPDALVATGYGRLLLLKTIGLLGLAALGWTARRRVARPSARLLRVEAAVMAAVLGVAAVLALAAP